MKVQLPSPTAFVGFRQGTGKQNMFKRPQGGNKTNQSEKQLSREDFKLFMQSVQSKCAIKQPEGIVEASANNDEKQFPLKYHLRYSKIEEDNGEDQESEITVVNDQVEKRGSKMPTDQSDQRFNNNYIQNSENYQGIIAFQGNHNNNVLKGQYPAGNQKKQLNNFVSPKNKNQVQLKDTFGVQKPQNRTTPFTKPFRKVSLPALLGYDSYSNGLNSPMKSQMESGTYQEVTTVKSNQEGYGMNMVQKPNKEQHLRTYSHGIETPQSQQQAHKQQFMMQFSGMNSNNKQNNKIGLLGQKNSNLLIGEVFNLDEKETQGLKEVLFKEVQGLKVQRNGYRQENNGLREKIVNMQKDIKVMNRQIERWSIESRLVFDEHEEPLIDAYSSEQVYDDPNFYLVSLQQRVKSYQKEENVLDDQIRLYQETMRVIRTDLKADERLVELERELMVQYHLLLEGKGVQDKDEILEARDGLQEAIRKLRESNRTLVAEIRLQKETQFENDAEIMKMEKHIEQRQIKIKELREEVKNKSPEELQAQKKVAKEKTLKLEEEKKNAIEMQAQQLANQAEQLHNLQFQFQEFRRDQILHSQQQLQVTQNFQQLLRRAKDIALRTRSSVQKKKKMIKAIKQKDNQKHQTSPIIEQFRYDFDNNPESIPQSNPITSHNSSSIGFQSQVPPKISLKDNFQSPTHSLTETPYVSSKNSPSRKVENSPEKQNINNLNLQRKSSLHRFHEIHPIEAAEQSLCSTYRGAFGESEKSQYDNDKPISVISCSTLTVDV